MVEARFDILLCVVFMLCRFPSTINTVHSHRYRLNPNDKILTKLKEMIFALKGKRLEHLECRVILCGHCPKFWTVSAGPGYKILREFIRCLYNNVIDRLFVAASQSINDCREQMLRLDTSQLALIRVPFVHKAY